MTFLFRFAIIVIVGIFCTIHFNLFGNLWWILALFVVFVLWFLLPLMNRASERTLAEMRKLSHPNCVYCMRHKRILEGDERPNDTEREF